jgi:hypothetical protein
LYFNGNKDLKGYRIYTPWYTGLANSNPSSQLPIGDPNNHFQVSFLIKIYNKYGAYAEYSQLKIKVFEVSGDPTATKPPNILTVDKNLPESVRRERERQRKIQEQEKLKAQANKILANLEASKPSADDDAQAMAAYTEAVMSVVNTRESIEKEISGKDDDADMIDETTGMMIVKPPKTAAQLKKEEEERQESIRLRDGLIDDISANFESKSMSMEEQASDIAFVASALTSVTKNAEIPAESQTKVASVLENMANTFKMASAGTELGSVKKTAIVESMGSLIDNMFEATDKVNDILVEKENQKDKKKEPELNDEKFGTGDNKATEKPATEKPLTNEERRERDLQKNNTGALMNTLDKIKDGLMRTTVVGEEPQVFKFSKFEMSVSKKRPEDLEQGMIGSESNSGYGFKMPRWRKRSRYIYANHDKQK